MRQARDRQRESIDLRGSNPGKSVANIFRHRSSSKRGHELPTLLNDNKVFLIDGTDKAELFSETRKTSIIIPVFKSGSRFDVNNYRGVHKTPYLAKLLERIIFNEILDFCLANRLLSSSQHGFLPKRSCETCHLAFLNLITSLRNERQSVVVIYFDLSKAFDKVPHRRLLVKLEALGIRPHLLDFIRSYLSDRCQKVMVGNSYSTPHSITSGVLQGTVLGPLLFLLYINDISTELGNSQTFMYADDLKCVYTI
ncbi:hypothetical protein SprV_0902651500 [Sparganum proliferum]